MLIQFSVENFLSFRDEVTFSMVAVRGDQRHPTHIVVDALGSGKSLLRAAAMAAARKRDFPEPKASTTMCVGCRWSPRTATMLNVTSSLNDRKFSTENCINIGPHRAIDRAL